MNDIWIVEYHTYSDLQSQWFFKDEQNAREFLEKQEVMLNKALKRKYPGTFSIYSVEFEDD